METTEQTAAVKEKIVAEAFSLFCQSGIKSVSMDDIAQHLSMSKKTIYKWFSNKDEVVYLGVSNYLQNIQCDSEDILSGSANAVDELFNIMGTTREIFSRIHPSIFHDLQKYHASAWQLWQDYKNQYIFSKVKKNLERGIAEGLYRKDLDVEVIARVRLVLIELPFNERIFPKHQFELMRVQLASLEHYMLGIATLKGHKLINEYKHITEEE
ncbi:TetR/AcrR family transcriptional regulator [Pontibacter roseus]|uniref:TetR/AcrR family transcriptional regulator n=1 Tax=Pontibacter roseus TaxID=336989 RepID=UPI00036A635F|nr:TetR/AcrR family transcriptional regulator [Pontibacter roseus]